ncbi:MAG: 1-phosphofructokinase family hexose kinase [Actinomycetota bacterium]|nr:1-phosphofructokinase family hexose kinase [Actinomycetota bacterium]
MSGIVTLTMNPALDITTSTTMVTPTDKLRCGPPRYDPGGGGINVARVIRVLGGSPIALFPAGGPSGRLLETLVAAEGVSVRRIEIDGSTRESFTVNEGRTGQQYRFVLPGPELTAAEQENCLSIFAEVARGAEYVVASGSLPPGVSPDFYQRVAGIVRGLGARLILDTSGEALRQMRSDVYLLKPSIRELRNCVGRELLSADDQLAAARELISAGVSEVVVLSLGEQGALAVTAQGHERLHSIDVPAGSGVGAGDSMLAAITVGLSRGWVLGDAVRLGIAAGAAMLLTPGTQPCLRRDVERLYAGLAGGRAHRTRRLHDEEGQLGAPTR